MIFLLLMDGGDWAEGGTQTVNTGMIIRQPDETGVTVLVEEMDGGDLAYDTKIF